MPQNKKGGNGRAAYTKLFDYPLSPCYKPTGKPEIFKEGWHAGGSGRAAYTKLFDYPLSPCYKPEGKPEIFKEGWHAGGGAAKFGCNTEPTVAQMGVYDQPLNPDPNASQVAWKSRYTCGATTASGNTQVGGELLRNVRDLGRYMKENRTKSYVLLVLGTYMRGNYKVSVFHFPRREREYSVSVEIVGTKGRNVVPNFEGFSKHSLKDDREVLELLKRYNVKEIQVQGRRQQRKETVSGRVRNVYFDEVKNREFYRERKDGKLVKKYLRLNSSNRRV